jgi:hypothetical protein
LNGLFNKQLLLEDRTTSKPRQTYSGNTVTTHETNFIDIYNSTSKGGAFALTGGGKKITINDSSF